MKRPQWMEAGSSPLGPAPEDSGPRLICVQLLDDGAAGGGRAAAAAVPAVAAAVPPPPRQLPSPSPGHRSRCHSPRPRCHLPVLFFFKSKGGIARVCLKAKIFIFQKVFKCQ